MAKTIKILWKYIFSHCKVIFILIVMSGVIYALTLAPIWAQKIYFDRLDKFLADNYLLIHLILWIVVFYMLRVISGGFLIPAAQAKDLYYEYILTRNVRKSQHYINNRIKLEYYDSTEMYNLMERSGSALTSGALRETINAFSSFLTLIISMLAIMFSLWILHYGFVILAVVSIFPAFLEYYWFQKKMYILEKSITEDRRKQNQCIEHIKGKTYSFETRISGTAPYFIKQWNEYRSKIEALQSKIYIKKIMFNFASGIVKSASFIGIIILATYLLSENLITIGSFTAVLGIAGMLFSYITHFIGILSQSVVKFHELKDIIKYYELEQEEGEGDDKIHPASEIGDITLTNVSFKYKSREKDAVKNINKTFKKGEKIAILGINGAGKTTLVNLIMGLYQPRTGNVCYNGIDINIYNKAKWREKITAVFQDYQTYKLSILENVIIGNLKNKDDFEIAVAALERAGFPYEKWNDGVNSLIGKEFDGIEMSKGEAQKLAIARSYFNSSAEILVIDEPTAALDPVSEENLYKKFIQEAEDKTTFIISHRLGSVRIAERILVMNASEIIEDGIAL